MDNWSLIYNDFEPEHEPLREALCALGNGYFATRGAGEETQADEIHYPGTYLAGGYNRLESVIAGRSIINEDFVNFPNWLCLNFCHEDGQWFNLLAVDILSYRQELCMREGVLKKEVRFRDHQGRETLLKTTRFVHMHHCHLAAIQYCLTPLNWSGSIFLQSMIDGSVINTGVSRYQELNSKHLDVLDMGEIDDQTIYLKVRTNQSHIEMTQAARTSIFKEGQKQSPSCETKKEKEKIEKIFSLSVKQNEEIQVEKVVSLYSSRDIAISETTHDATIAIQHAESFEKLMDSHRRAWDYVWHRCDVEIDSAGQEQLILRLHIFHLLQSVSFHTINLDVGVPARGLHGEAYRGHVFWDELFIFPFLTLRMPEITRSLLLYRYRRLEMARRLAKDHGFQGAMYPWQSGSNGEEETQEVHLNPRTSTWGADYSRNQRHVNAAIVYNIWQYYQLTNDERFLYDFGAEMILEIARLWSSMTSFNDKTRRYEIIGIMGPDEYHESDPSTDQSGLRNNAYTNVLAVWVLERALEVLDILHPDRRQEVIEQLSIQPDELSRWNDITNKMTIPFLDNGIISQFEGYENLKEFDWECYSKQYGNIERLDRILKAEGDSPDHYKASKQADVLMLFYLFPRRELRRIFHQLGYPFDDDTVRKNLEYYQKRTSHGSTLSKVVFASVVDYVDRDAAWHFFQEALVSDISDIQGGTTPEGIHLGAMASTVDIVTRHFAGINARLTCLSFTPRLPKEVKNLKMRLCYREQWFKLDITKEKFKLLLEKDGNDNINIEVFGKNVQLRSGEELELKISKPRPILRPLISSSSVWHRLTNHYKSMKYLKLNDLFAEDKKRFEKFSFQLNDILVDFSKNHIKEETIDLLLKLAYETNLEDRIQELFAGEKINKTEAQAALHTALRDFSHKELNVDGVNIKAEIKSVYEQMKHFVGEIQNGNWLGFNGEAITDIVHVGIGGSSLGPEFIIEALKENKSLMNVHFVSAMDGREASSLMKTLNPATTLFIIVSKTFTTIDTMSNAKTFLEWMENYCNRDEALKKHFIGISADVDAMKEFGLQKENRFVFWKWVGGRYSLWSSVGLTIALCFGMDVFDDLLKGASEVDHHFRTMPLEKNIPVLMALLTIWNTNFYNLQTHAILPYDSRLVKLPSYLQQLEMESCGKSVTNFGQRVNYQTEPVIWGDVGFYGQHAFYQLLHQGTQIVPVDFILNMESEVSLENHQNLALANALAQSQALMQGRSEKETKVVLEKEDLPDELSKKLLPHRVYQGDRPSTTIVLPTLSPHILGSLIALYEHKVFVQSVIWEINPFDQWGVEYGKTMAKELLPVLSGQVSLKDVKLDHSTRGIIEYILKKGK